MARERVALSDALNVCRPDREVGETPVRLPDGIVAPTKGGESTLSSILPGAASTSPLCWRSLEPAMATEC